VFIDKVIGASAAGTISVGLYLILGSKLFGISNCSNPLQAAIMIIMVRAITDRVDKSNMISLLCFEKKSFV
jgi:hypothetical protein